MSNWNMPPGVNTNMIPGNRPEDIMEEQFWAAFEAKLDEKKFTGFTLDKPAPSANFVSLDDLWDNAAFVEIIGIARDMGFDQGYAEGSSDEAMQIGALESEIDTRLQDWFYDHQEVTAQAYLAKRAEIRHQLTKDD